MHPIRFGHVDVARPPALDAELTHVLRGGPFSAALHLAIEANGWSLERLQAALLERGVGISMSTLSYWRRGRSRPERPESLRAVGLLEEVLGLPERSLLTLLGARRPRGRWLDHPVAAAPLQRLWPHADDLARLYTRVSDSRNDHLTRLSVSDDYYVGPDRYGYRLVSRLVVRADADRVARCLVVLWTEQRDGAQPAAITATRYCRTGRIRDEDSTGYTVAELVLDRVLSAGECAVLEYEMAIPHPVDDSDEFARRFTEPTRQYALSVVFEPEVLPARCYGYQRLAHNGPDRWIEEIWPAGNTVQFVAVDFASGIVGLRWDWD